MLYIVQSTNVWPLDNDLLIRSNIGGQLNGEVGWNYAHYQPHKAKIISAFSGVQRLYSKKNMLYGTLARVDYNSPISKSTL